MANKDDILREMQRRLSNHPENVPMMKQDAYTRLAVSVMFEVASEMLSDLENIELKTVTSDEGARFSTRKIKGIIE